MRNRRWSTGLALALGALCFGTLYFTRSRDRSETVVPASATSPDSYSPQRSGDSESGLPFLQLDGLLIDPPAGDLRNRRWAEKPNRAAGATP